MADTWGGSWGTSWGTSWGAGGGGGAGAGDHLPALIVQRRARLFWALLILLVHGA